jgi:dephospho-CoA kinase
MMMDTPRALALVGMPGAGKTVCARHLDQQGYYTFRFGQIVVDEVARRGWPLNPENERIVREEFRQQEGINAIARRALPYLKAALAQRPCIVIDGLYGFGEYKLLQEELPGTMAVVAVVSERGLRYQRLAERPERPLTPTEAARRDYAEIENLEKGGPIAIADFTLLNNGVPDALLASLDGLVARLNFRAR